MAYNAKLADRIRKYLVQFPKLKIEEKKMFGGLSFMINSKMCINVSGENLMCRFDPTLTKKLSYKKGFSSMKMRGKEYLGYCYVEPVGFMNNKDFDFWVNLCSEFNDKAKSSKE